MEGLGLGPRLLGAVKVLAMAQDKHSYYGARLKLLPLQLLFLLFMSSRP